MPENEAQAVIRWRQPTEGGRAEPPRSGYKAVVRFDDDPDWQNHGAWSVIVRDIVAVDGPNVVVATVSFVMGEAPKHLLEAQRHFDLMEGPNAVGRGLVVSCRDAASAA